MTNLKPEITGVDPYCSNLRRGRKVPTAVFDKYRSRAAEVVHLNNDEAAEKRFLNRNDQMWRRVRNAKNQLQLISDSLPDLKPGKDIALVFVARNEGFRLPYFFDYYRKLGVTHFLYVDNDSTDGSVEYARAQPDCTVWWTDASYAEAKSGLGWFNYILNAFCHGLWTLVVDPDEFLVYDGIERLKLPDLISRLHASGDVSLSTTLVDMYSKGPVEDAVYQPHQNPLDVCPYFDGEGYVFQKVAYNGTIQINGGPRARLFSNFSESTPPALNKTALLHFTRGSLFLSSTHIVSPAFYNKSVHSGALLHFKFFSSFSKRVDEEISREEHYKGAIEYKLYKKFIDKNRKNIMHYPGSRRFQSVADLVDIGLVTPIR